MKGRTETKQRKTENKTDRRDDRKRVEKAAPSLPSTLTPLLRRPNQRGTRYQ
jgi:hypothetical protein